MKVYEGLKDLPTRRRASAVTIGNFDGVHRGHRAILRRLRARARKVKARPTVITFEPHPRRVLQGEAPPLLVTPEYKAELLQDAGVGALVVLRFTKRLSLMEPEEFIEKVLLSELKARAVVVGSGFRFGHFARGDTRMLRSFGRRLGFSFEGVREVEVEGRLVSSTAIRHAASEGDLAWANRALGRPHRLEGTVVRGRGRGVRLGFPTANLKPHPHMVVPKLGIYAGYLIMEQRRLPSAISVGTNPQFGSNPVSVEAHLLDFAEDLYGRGASVEFEEYLRGERKFPSVEALVEAMHQDVRRARRLLGEPGTGSSPQG